jgi:hypothetical protein
MVQTKIIIDFVDFIINKILFSPINFYIQKLDNLHHKYFILFLQLIYIYILQNL